MYIHISAAGVINQWDALDRDIILFDASPIADTDDVTSVTMSVWGTSKLDNFPTPLAMNMDIYTSTPASTSNLVAADFQQVGSVSQTGGAVITYANFTLGAYNDFVFNATGRSNVSKTGISKFGIRNANYDVSTNVPLWQDAGTTYMQMNTADVAGTANDPKLVVVHTAVASGFIPKITWW